MTLSIAIAGAAGRMGRALARAASANGGFRLSGGTERTGGAYIGADLGAVAGVGAQNVTISDNAALAARDADVWIDFTTPAATLSALESLAGTKVRAAIVGTTGFSPGDEAKLGQAAGRIALVRSGNFSLGVNLIAALTKQAAQRLGAGWDIEIVEVHHRRKVDAPSGTALMLGEAAAEGRKLKLEDARLAPRDGQTGPRPESGIGFAVVRGGGIIGKHDVIFAGEREIITLSHEALDRALFADGALVAAQWAADKKPGLYSMRDVLGF